jgi:hypothetical protein
MATRQTLKDTVYAVTAIIMAYHRDDIGYDSAIMLLMKQGLTEAQADRALTTCSAFLRSAS